VLVRGLRARASLSRRGEARLLAAAKESPCAFVLYLLAVRAGLGARECAGLDVGDVSVDGLQARSALCVRTMDRRRLSAATSRERPIDGETRGAIEVYLAWRQGRCAHFKLRLRTLTDAGGVVRCHACHEPIDFLKSPLFLGRRGQRVATQWLRERFRGVRRELRLPADVRFGQLGRRHFDRRPASEDRRADQAGDVSAEDVAVRDAVIASAAKEDGRAETNHVEALVPGRRDRS
jgi:hypothetical protein